MSRGDGTVVRVAFAGTSNSEDAVALYEDVMKVVYGYEDKMLLATALGVLECVKSDLIDQTRD